MHSEENPRLNNAFCKAKERVGPTVKSHSRLKHLGTPWREAAEAAAVDYVKWLFGRTVRPRPSLEEFDRGTAADIRGVAHEVSLQAMNIKKAWDDPKLTPQIRSRLAP